MSSPVTPRNVRVDAPHVPGDVVLREGPPPPRARHFPARLCQLALRVGGGRDLRDAQSVDAVVRAVLVPPHLKG
eukprot:8480017-Pyramimonas_sp.AAC.1